MSSPKVPPRLRNRPRDKPLTQPHELEGISPRRQIMFVIGLFAGAFAMSWLATSATICLHLGPHAFFVEHVRFSNRSWRLTTGEDVSAAWQLVCAGIWTVLMVTWKTLWLVIIQTLQEFR